MPFYRFRAVDGTGKIISGVLEAKSREEVLENLWREGHTPLRAEEGRSPKKSIFSFSSPKKGSLTQLADFTEELSTLLEGGIPIDRALGMMASLPAALGETVSAIRAKVQGGSSLTSALVDAGPPFDAFYLHMCHAGEASGNLSGVLAEIAKSLRTRLTLSSRLRQALIYPLVLLGTTFLSVAAIFLWVVPQFKTMLAESEGALPWSTRLLLFASDVFRNDWPWLALSGILLFLGLARALKGRGDALLLRLPALGTFLAAGEQARFCITLGTLLQHGVGLLQAVGIASGVVGNRVIREPLAQVPEDLKRGRSLSEALSPLPHTPKLLVHMTEVGEEAGALSRMLLRAGALYEREAAKKLEGFVALLEPALILFLGAVVGFVVLSLLVAILSVNELAVS